MYTITQIIDVKPYVIVAKFNTGEERLIDFLPLVTNFTSLKDPNIFLKASIDDYPTISWEGLATVRELDRTIKSCPLDFSPETLFKLSSSYFL